jgi:hypothetical protein
MQSRLEETGRDLAARIPAYPKADRLVLRAKLASAEVLRLTFRNQQVRYLRTGPDPLPVATIATLFGLAKSTVSDIIRMSQASEEAANRDEIQKPLFAGNGQILSQQEEDMLLDWIHSRHCNGNCSTAHKVRVYAQAIYFNRIQAEITWARDWWRSFKNRHQEMIEI